MTEKSINKGKINNKNKKMSWRNYKFAWINENLGEKKMQECDWNKVTVCRLKLLENPQKQKKMHLNSCESYWQITKLILRKININKNIIIFLLLLNLK